MSDKSNKAVNEWRDREPGKPGTGYTANDMPTASSAEGSPKKLNEKAVGWTSKSFDPSLFKESGVSGNDYCYPDSYTDDSGPAWPSHSKDRK